MEVYSTHTSTGQEEARLYMALCEWAPHVILRDRVLTVKCYCGKSSIPISSAGCPGCGYGRCAYCTTTRVQVRASAAKSQLQKADGPALSIRALSRTSGHRPLSSSNAYKSWAKPPASDMDIHRHNQQASDTTTSVCSGAPLQQIVSGAELCEERPVSSHAITQCSPSCGLCVGFLMRV